MRGSVGAVGYGLYPVAHDSGGPFVCIYVSLLSLRYVYYVGNGILCQSIISHLGKCVGRKALLLPHAPIYLFILPLSEDLWNCL